MPKPFRRTVARRSSPEAKARAAKNDTYMRGLYHRVGPAEFWRRRLCWLVENGKWVSYIRLVRTCVARELTAGRLPIYPFRGSLTPTDTLAPFGDCKPSEL